MSGDSSKIEPPPRSRQVLSDVSNYLVKRGFSLTARDVGLKPGDGYGKRANIDNGGLNSAKQRRLGVENVVNDKCRLRDKDTDSSLLRNKPVCGLSHPFTSTSSSQDSITSTIPAMPHKPKETSNSLQSHCNPPSGNVPRASILETGYASKDSRESTVSIPTYSELSDRIGEYHREEQGLLDSTRSNPVCEGLAACSGTTSITDPCSGKLESSYIESVDRLRLPKSQGSKDFSLERCTGDKAEGRANLNNCDGVLGECTCSFCLKAAYIWSDLYYQDFNGRIAALKKSKKEASILVQKSCRGKNGKDNSNKSSKLESDLTNQWRLLFLHMEDILNSETKQLQTSILALKDLRDNCKKDVEMINADGN